MNDNKIWCNVEVKLDTDERISGELADLLFDCGLEILRMDGDAIICNQSDVVSVDDEIYISIGLGKKRVNSVETALSMIDAIDSFTVFEDDGFLLIQGDGVVIDEPNAGEIKRSAKDITAKVFSSEI
ncbi:hypothetical protein [Halorubrum tebenquichense]|uniref:hypothetical protein n=1 Tax=Halorubrum tebenquichense TaxID=119434 RepID=UPI001268B5F9|nr:hypothetical protein [Halorubrum tebenquichense]